MKIGDSSRVGEMGRSGEEAGEVVRTVVVDG